MDGYEKSRAKSVPKGVVQRFFSKLDCGFHRRNGQGSDALQNSSPYRNFQEYGAAATEQPNRIPSTDNSNRNSSQVARLPRHNVSWSDGYQSIHLDEDLVAQAENSDLESIVDVVKGPRINELVAAARHRGTKSRPIFGDGDFVAISQELANQGKPKWSLRPRIYTLLWLLGREDDMDLFLDLVDANIPLDPSLVREKLGHNFSEADLDELQPSLHSRMVELERPGSAHLQLEGLSRYYFNTLNTLGRGRHAYVEEVQSRFTLKVYALKRLPSDFIADPGDSKLLNEILILRGLRHRHLVQFVASFTDYKSVALLMTPVADMDLDVLLDKVHELSVQQADVMAQEKFKDHCKTLKTFYGCLANALAYLHRNNVRHKDIKPANILVKDQQVYLSDFALARRWNDDSVSRGDVGEYTPRYAAPEVVDETASIYPSYGP